MSRIYIAQNANGLYKRFQEVDKRSDLWVSKN